jgi:hypothetical protein
MKAQKQMRSSVQVGGSFFSLPEAFPGADDAVKYAPKFEFRANKRVNGNQPLQFEAVLQPNHILLDLAAVDASGFDARKLIRDCELVKQAAEAHPDKLRAILASFAEGTTDKEIRRAAQTVAELGLDEEQVTKAGGGLIWFVVIGAAALLGSCRCPSPQTDETNHP